MSNMTLQTLIQDQDEEIKSEFVDLYDYPKSRDDRLTEIVDGNVPIYHADRASVLASAPGLDIEDSGLIGDNPTIMDLIGIAIYERLSEAAYEEFDSLSEQFESFKDEKESEGYECIRRGLADYAIVYGEEPEEGCDDVREVVATGGGETKAWLAFMKEEGEW